MWCGDMEFKFVDNWRVYMVRLNARYYYYCLFHVCGIPYKHAIAYDESRRLSIPPFVNSMLSRQSYIATYDHVIQPILDQSEWPNVQCNNLYPSIRRTKASRPKRARRRASNEDPKRAKSFT